MAEGWLGPPPEPNPTYGEEERLNYVTRTNPSLAQDPAAALGMSRSGLSLTQLAKTNAKSSQIVELEKVRDRLLDADPDKEWEEWNSYSEDQQQMLLQVGYTPMLQPEEDKDTGFFENLGAIASQATTVLNVPGIKQVAGLFNTAAGAVTHAYRTQQSMLDRGIAETFNPMAWSEEWGNTGDGARFLREEGRNRVLDQLDGDRSQFHIVQELSTGIEPERLALIQLGMDPDDHGDAQKLFMQQMQEQGIDVQTAMLEMINISKDPKIQKAVETYRNNTTSWGRDIAHRVGIHDGALFTFVSGSNDALFAMFADPTLVAGAGFKSLRYGARGLHQTQTAADLVGFHAAGTGFLGRTNRVAKAQAMRIAEDAIGGKTEWVANIERHTGIWTPEGWVQPGAADGSKLTRVFRDKSVTNTQRAMEHIAERANAGDWHLLLDEMPEVRNGIGSLKQELQQQVNTRLHRAVEGTRYADEVIDGKKLVDHVADATNARNQLSELKRLHGESILKAKEAGMQLPTDNYYGREIAKAKAKQEAAETAIKKVKAENPDIAQVLDYTPGDIVDYFKSTGGAQALLEGRWVMPGYPVTALPSVSPMRAKLAMPLRTEMRQVLDFNLNPEEWVKQWMDDVLYDSVVPEPTTLDELGQNIKLGVSAGDVLPGVPAWEPSMAGRIGMMELRTRKGAASFIKGLTTLIPTARFINPDTPEATTEFMKLLDFSLPYHTRNDLLNQFIDSQGMYSTQRNVYASAVDMLLTAAGARTFPEGQKMIERFVGKIHQSYASNGKDLMNTGLSKKTPEGIWVSDMANAWEIPAFRDLMEATKNANLVRRGLGATHSKVPDILMRAWKPAMLLKLGFIPRAYGEEMMGFILRAGFGKEWIKAQTAITAALPNDKQLLLLRPPLAILRGIDSKIPVLHPLTAVANRMAQTVTEAVRSGAYALADADLYEAAHELIENATVQDAVVQRLGASASMGDLHGVPEVEGERTTILEMDKGELRELDVRKLTEQQTYDRRDPWYDSVYMIKLQRLKKERAARLQADVVARRIAPNRMSEIQSQLEEFFYPDADEMTAGWGNWVAHVNDITEGGVDRVIPSFESWLRNPAYSTNVVIRDMIEEGIDAEVAEKVVLAIQQLPVRERVALFTNDGDLERHFRTQSLNKRLSSGGEGVFYHSTGTPWVGDEMADLGEALEAGKISGFGAAGPGLYTAINQEPSMTFGMMGASEVPTTYRIQWTGEDPPNLLQNLQENPITAAGGRPIIERLFGGPEGLSDAIVEAPYLLGANGQISYKAALEYVRSNRAKLAGKFSDTEISKVMYEEVISKLIAQGYDGFVGGKGAHAIFFSTKNLSVSDVQDIAGTTVRQAAEEDAQRSLRVLRGREPAGTVDAEEEVRKLLIASNTMPDMHDVRRRAARANQLPDGTPVAKPIPDGTRRVYTVLVPEDADGEIIESIASMEMKQASQIRYLAMSNDIAYKDMARMHNLDLAGTVAPEPGMTRIYRVPGDEPYLTTNTAEIQGLEGVEYTDVPSREVPKDLNAIDLTDLPPVPPNKTRYFRIQFDDEPDPIWTNDAAQAASKSSAGADVWYFDSAEDIQLADDLAINNLEDLVPYPAPQRAREYRPYFSPQLDRGGYFNRYKIPDNPPAEESIVRGDKSWFTTDPEQAKAMLDRMRKEFQGRATPEYRIGYVDIPEADFHAGRRQAQGTLYGGIDPSVRTDATNQVMVNRDYLHGVEALDDDYKVLARPGAPDEVDFVNGIDQAAVDDAWARTMRDEFKELFRPDNVDYADDFSNVAYKFLDDSLDIEDIHPIPKDQMPDTLDGPKFVVHKSEHVLNRMVRFGFDKVVGPAGDAMVRNHIFLTNYARSLKETDRFMNMFMEPHHMENLARLSEKTGKSPRQIMRQWDRLPDDIKHAADPIATALRDDPIPKVFRDMENAEFMQFTTQMQLMGEGDTDAVDAVFETVREKFQMNMGEFFEMWNNLPGRDEILRKGVLPEFFPTALKDLDVNDLKQLQQAADSSQYVRKLQNDIALRRSINDTIPYIDDHRVRSQFQEHMRNLIPFHFAEENFVKRMIRTLKYSPEAVRRAQLLNQGFTEAGVFYENEYGETIFNVPFSAGLARLLFKGRDFITKTSMPFSNPITGQVQYALPGIDRFGFPSFGPIIGLSFNALRRNFPEFKQAEKFILGERAAGRSAVEWLMPAYAHKLYNAIIHDTDADRHVAASMIAAMQTLEATGHGLPENATPDQQEEFMERATEWSRANLILKGVFGFISPAAPDSDPPNNLAPEFSALLRDMSYEDAYATFIAKNPDGHAYTVFATESASGAPLPATPEAAEMLTEHSDFFARYPDAGPWLLPQSDDDDPFNREAYLEQKIHGMRVDKSPDEWLRDYRFAKAAPDYFDSKKAKDLLLASKKNPQEKQAIKDQWAVWKEDYFAQHPVFAEEIQNPAGQQRRERILSTIQEAYNDELAPQVPWKQEILDLVDSYQGYKTQLDALKNGPGSGSAYGKIKRQNLEDQFTVWLDDYVRKHPQVDAFYNRVIRVMVESGD